MPPSRCERSAQQCEHNAAPAGPDAWVRSSSNPLAPAHGPNEFAFESDEECVGMSLWDHRNGSIPRGWLEAGECPRDCASCRDLFLRQLG